MPYLPGIFRAGMVTTITSFAIGLRYRFLIECSSTHSDKSAADIVTAAAMTEH